MPKSNNQKPNATGSQPIVRTAEEPLNTSTSDPVINENTAATPIPQVETKKKTVEVDVDVLKNIMDRLDDLTTKTGEYEKTASQDQIRKIEGLRAQGKLVKNVKIRVYAGRFVLGWKVTKDDVWVADGKLHEEQVVEMHFEDGTKQERPLLDFTRNTSYLEAEVIRESKLANGDTELTVMTKDGKELTTNSKFVN